MPPNPNPVNLPENGTGFSLKVTPLYSKGVYNTDNAPIYDRVCVYHQVNGVTVWSQPILIM
jgi:hypothetical protein